MIIFVLIMRQAKCISAPNFHTVESRKYETFQVYPFFRYYPTRIIAYQCSTLYYVTMCVSVSGGVGMGFVCARARACAEAHALCRYLYPYKSAFEHSQRVQKLPFTAARRKQTIFVDAPSFHSNVYSLKPEDHGICKRERQSTKTKGIQRKCRCVSPPTASSFASRWDRKLRLFLSSLRRVPNSLPASLREKICFTRSEGCFDTI